MKIYDISVPVSKALPLWPKSSGLRFKKVSEMSKKALVNETHFEMNAHIGTHIDAPLHFVHRGASIDQAPLEVFMGEVSVVYLPKVKEIRVEDLEKLEIPKGVKRILFKTENSKLWQKGSKFNKDYVGLTPLAARWLVKKGFKLVGIDYLSIAKMSEAIEVHQILLGRGVYILESLNLSAVPPGTYILSALPVKMAGAEAAPTRAILIKP